MPPKVRPIGPDDLVARTFTLGKTGFSLPYRLYVPRDYVQSQRYPLLVVLHGAGERGVDNEKHLGNGVLAFGDPALQKKRPTFVIYPQCPEAARWVETPWEAGDYDQSKVPLSRPLTAVMELVAALESEFTLDPNRVLLAGLSMGGYGVWDLVTRFPVRFAGALAICGGGDPSVAARAKEVPIWAFHGALDPVVPPKGSRLMIEALRKAGGKVKYTELKKGDHHIWEGVFADKTVVNWLLSQRRPGPAANAAATPKR
jgi:predicted peptidase